MTVPRHAVYERNRRLYAPITQEEATQIAQARIDPRCAAVAHGEDAVIVMRREDGHEMIIGTGWSWTEALSVALRALATPETAPGAKPS